MKDEKRILKGYKIKDSYYQKAMKRAKKEKGSLAPMVEFVVKCYASGFSISATDGETGHVLTIAPL